MTSKTIRSIDERVFRDLKGEAARKGIPVGEAVNEALRLWVAENRRRSTHKRSLLKMQASDWGEGTENSSTEIDETLYGGHT